MVRLRESHWSHMSVLCCEHFSSPYVSVWILSTDLILNTMVLDELRTWLDTTGEGLVNLIKILRNSWLPSSPPGPLCLGRCHSASSGGRFPGISLWPHLPCLQPPQLSAWVFPSMVVSLSVSVGTESSHRSYEWLVIFRSLFHLGFFVSSDV